jgi:hypothetical protein
MALELVYALNIRVASSLDCISIVSRFAKELLAPTGT